MNQTIFFTHFIPRVQSHQSMSSFFSYFFKYYGGPFVLLFVMWHIMRSIMKFDQIETRIAVCEMDIQNLKRKRDETTTVELVDVSRKRQRVFRRHPRNDALFKFGSVFDFESGANVGANAAVAGANAEEVKTDDVKVNEVKTVDVEVENKLKDD
jgi:hypothetical protein